MQLNVQCCSHFCLVREQVDGVLSSAAVPRGGLGPPPPPLCRCAEYTADLLLRPWLAIHRCASIIPLRSSGTWCAQRSGIKEEAAGRGTAAKLCTPSARASTELKARFPYRRKQATCQADSRFKTNGMCSCESHWQLGQQAVFLYLTQRSFGQCIHYNPSARLFVAGNFVG